MSGLDSSLQIVILVLIFGIFFTVVYLLIDIYSRKKRFEEEILKLKLDNPSLQDEAPTLFKKKSSAIEKKVDGYLKKIREDKKLYLIDFVKQHPYFLKILVASIFLFFLFFYTINIILKQSTTVTFCLSLVVDFLFGRALFKFFENRRKRAFLKSFPLALDIITRGLRAGLSIEKTFEVISREVKGSVGDEFSYICEQMQLGLPYELALAESARRVYIQDYHFFISSLLIQKSLGGSLAGFMENIATIIRRQDELRLKIQALSSESKTTGMIIGSLPFFTLAAISYFRPEHFEVFQKDPVGQKIILVALGLIIFAQLLVNRLTTLEV